MDGDQPTKTGTGPPRIVAATIFTGSGIGNLAAPKCLWCLWISGIVGLDDVRAEQIHVPYD